MTTKNQYHRAALLRRIENERRQATRQTTVKVAPTRPVATRPVRPPAQTPVKTPVRSVTPVTPVTPTPTPVRPTVVAQIPTVLPTVLPSVSPPSISTPITSVVPISTPPSSLPLPTTSSTSLRPSTTANRAISTSLATITGLPSSTSSATPSTTSGVSTGAVVGGIIGGFAALGLIGAALFLYLRRTKEKREKNDEAFNATKFRQSAIMLDDPAEKHGKPRPPTVIEQHVQSRPSPQPNSLPPSMSAHYPTEQTHYGVPYGNSSNYGSGYPGSYPSQNPYEQYPPQATPYGYGTSHGYPPHPQYPPQSHYGAQHYGVQQYNAHPSPTPSPAHRPSSLEYGQDGMSLPNPFAASSSLVSGTGPSQHSSNASPSSTTRELTASTSTHNPQTTESSDAPPAYEVTNKYKDFKADLKVKPGLVAINMTSDTNGVPASSTLSPTAAGSATVSPTQSRATDKMALTRPLSGTSAITTVYDPNDAYGGM